jgi:nitrous oxidase accessory protein
LLATFLLLTMLPAGVSAATTHDVHQGDSIQAVVDQAKPGDVITVHEGVYEQSVIFKDKQKGITLKGEKGTVLDGTILASKYPDEVYAMIVIDDAVTNTVIEGFEIRNWPGAAVTIFEAHNNVVSNNRISNCNYGVETYGDNNRITGNEFTNIKEQAIWLGGANSNTVVGNRVSECGADGMWLGSSSNNLIKQNVVSGTMGVGIFLGWKSSKNVISSNIVFNSGYVGILLHEESSSNEVTNNSISGSFLDGIKLQGFSSKNLLEANQISDSGDRGILVAESNDDTIRNNLVWNSASYGIFLVNSSRISVVSNLVTASGAGIDLNWNGVGGSIEWKDNIGTIGQIP